MTDQQAIDLGYMEGQRSFECLVSKLFESFNFENVYKTMKALDWGWSVNGSDEVYIPTVKALKKEAYEMLRKVYDEKIASLSSGGFNYGFDDGHLYLTFTVEEEHTCNIF